MLNSRDVNLLRPDVAANCHIFVTLMKEAGYDVIITGTVRDNEYQKWCCDNGYANTPIPSFHSVAAGLAFDICKNRKGEEYSDLTFWVAAGRIGKKLGFTWGGDWTTIKDRPHFQWDEHKKFTGTMIRNGKRPALMPLYQEENVKIENITVAMNGKPTTIPAILHEGHYYVQIRSLAEAQTDDKLTVAWDDKAKQVIINSK